MLRRKRTHINKLINNSVERENILIFLYNKLLLIKLFIFLFIFLFILFILSERHICYPLRTFVHIGFVVHVHVFNVHRGSIASKDHLKAGHDISQSSLWCKLIG